MRVLLLILGILSSCASSKSKNSITIRGELSGLPNGKIYILNLRREVIDSTETRDGHFLFSIPSQNNRPIPYSLVTMEHRDSKKVKRLFSFKTNRKYRNAPWQSEAFILEDGLVITGKLEEFTPAAIQLPDSIRLVYPSNLLKGGKQTSIMFNIDYDFSKPINDTAFAKVKSLVQKYPYAYYFLHEINSNRSNYSSKQLNDLLNHFDKNLLTQPEALELLKVIEIRKDSKHKLSTSLFTTLNNNKTNAVRPNAKINMIVLWASWCSPCIQEIPDIKKIFYKHKNDKRLNIVSISLDDNRDDWLNALKKYSMPWQQLWVSDDVRPYQQDIFQFDGSIPCVLFVNNEGKILNKIIGYAKENINRYETEIESQLR